MPELQSNDNMFVPETISEPSDEFYDTQDRLHNPHENDYEQQYKAANNARLNAEDHAIKKARM
ncbi:MAG: hypothetical protein OEX11_09255, partial [Nitrosomonas sp.]|nr:hypothetical protein [Nitrosomonas sp.]